MKEETLIDLGFTKTIVPTEESGYHREYYYYTLDIGDIGLISNCDDEAEEGWSVKIFEFDSLTIKNGDTLKTLVCLIKANTK